MSDLDHSKRVNDADGHPVGNAGRREDRVYTREKLKASTRVRGPIFPPVRNCPKGRLMFEGSRILRVGLVIGLAATLAGCAPKEPGPGGGVAPQGNGQFIGRVTFSLGSLVAEGDVALGNLDAVVTLTAGGVPLVTCTSPGGNQAPGQNPPRVSGSDSQTVERSFTKNGRSPFVLEADAQTALSAKRLGCPNNNWKASIDFVFWDRAVLTLTNSATGAMLEKRVFACVTQRDPDSVSCTEL
ncbi:hypothetical protein Mterra_02183 [Calidithermus terrae]|uniref:Uncharacterized protein n=2 Tax=Calidithermus terrae TaxID=1408545 RepID=A0A399ENP4_9DEIN|nr:hypothetical protein Mterra_02183 [Calidithermus terrae]